MKRHRQRLLIVIVLVVLSLGVGTVSWRLLGRQGQPKEERSTLAQIPTQGAQEQASDEAAATGEVGKPDTRPALPGIEGLIDFDQFVEQEVKMASTAEDVPRINVGRKKLIDSMARMSLEEVADNIDDRYTDLSGTMFEGSRRRRFSAAFWPESLPANIMVLRLIEEGRKDPDRVCAMLEKSLARKIDEFWEIPEQRYDEMEFAIEAGFYVLANIDRLNDPVLLERWFAAPGRPSRWFGGLALWFTDCYFRSPKMASSPYAAIHCAIPKNAPLPNERHMRQKWDQAWEVGSPWRERSSAHVGDANRIEVLTVPFNSLFDGAVVGVVENWLEYVKQLEKGS